MLADILNRAPTQPDEPQRPADGTLEPGSCIGADVRLLELRSILVRQKSLARTLLRILRAEDAALRSRNCDELCRAAADRTRTIAALETLERSRRAVCERLGIGPGQDEMDAWLTARCQGSPSLLPLHRCWQSLTALLGECRGTSQATGMVVATLRRRIQRAMDRLGSSHLAPAVDSMSGDPPVTPSARAIART